MQIYFISLCSDLKINGNMFMECLAKLKLVNDEIEIFLTDY